MSFLSIAQSLGQLGNDAGNANLINQRERDNRNAQAFQQYLETQRLGMDAATNALRQKEFDFNQKKAAAPWLETRPDGTVYQMGYDKDGNITAAPFTGFPALKPGEKPDIDKMTEFIPDNGTRDSVRMIAKSMPPEKALEYIGGIAKDNTKAGEKLLSDHQQLRQDFYDKFGRWPNLEEDEQLLRKTTKAGEGAPGETIKDRKASFTTLNTTHNENWTKALSEYNTTLAKFDSDKKSYDSAVKEWEKAGREHYILGAGPKPIFNPSVTQDDVLAAKNKLALASEARNYVNSNRDSFVLRGATTYEDLYGKASQISNLPVPTKVGEKPSQDVVNAYAEAFGNDPMKIKKMLMTVGYR